MAIALTSDHYMSYIELIADRIHQDKDYITELDAATGDGDHWANLNAGFQEIVKHRESFSQLSLTEMFQQMGMKMMNAVGGSSGVLYGSAFLAAAKVCREKTVLDASGLCEVLEAMVQAMMKRGNSQPGQKTMIDSIYPAVEEYKKCLAEEVPPAEMFAKVKQAAAAGAEATREMEAVRGRACYQANKGVGHLDPGAVTMSYQIETLMDYLKEALIS